MSKRATKKQIYKACKILQAGTTLYSCCALARATSISMYKYNGVVTNENCRDYQTFFGFHWKGGAWPFTDAHGTGSKYERIMALLLYLEARDSI